MKMRKRKRTHELLLELIFKEQTKAMTVGGQTSEAQLQGKRLGDWRPGCLHCDYEEGGRSHLGNDCPRDSEAQCQSNYVCVSEQRTH